MTLYQCPICKTVRYPDDGTSTRPVCLECSCDMDVVKGQLS